MGGFKKEYGKGYWEDTDLGLEVAAAGYKVVYQPMSVVVHNEGGSLSADKEALMKRNHKYFISKWKRVLQVRVGGSPNRWGKRGRGMRGGGRGKGECFIGEEPQALHKQVEARAAGGWWECWRVGAFVAVEG